MLGKKCSLFNGSYEYKALQLAGFDVGVLGNHDFDGGVKTLLRLVQNWEIPCLGIKC